MTQNLYKKVLPFFILLTSCFYDPAPQFDGLVNTSGSHAILELHFDSSAYKAYWTQHDFRVFLIYGYGHTDPKAETKLVSVDTLHLIQTYSIPARGTFSFGGWGTNNEGILRKIRLISKSDTLELKNIEQIKQAFKKIDENKNRFEVE